MWGAYSVKEVCEIYPPSELVCPPPNLVYLAVVEDWAESTTLLENCPVVRGVTSLKSYHAVKLDRFWGFS